MKQALFMCHELAARWTLNSPVLLLLDIFQVQTSSVEDFGVIESASYLHPNRQYGITLLSNQHCFTLFPKGAIVRQKKILKYFE